MDILPPPCTSFFIDRTPPLSLGRRYSSPSFPSPRLSKYRRRVSSELQTTPVDSGNGMASSYSTSVPTHKVTVHDRQRGVVHEFLVPEVCLKWDPFLLWIFTGHGKNVAALTEEWAVVWIVLGFLNRRISTFCTRQSLRTSLCLSLAGTVLFSYAICWLLLD